MENEKAETPIDIIKVYIWGMASLAMITFAWLIINYLLLADYHSEFEIGTEELKELVELEKKLAAMDPETADKSALEELKAEKKRVTDASGALAQRYGLYMQKLFRIQGDVTEFRMPGEDSELPTIGAPE